METPTPGRTPAPRPTRGERKAETQARIIESAIALFAVRGYERTSIAAVAARARVSRSAVFWHFGDKEALFREAFRRMLIPFVDEMRDNLQGDPAQRIFDLIEVYERFVQAQSDQIQSMVRWVLESPGLRSSLREPLFSLHDQFLADVHAALVELLEEPAEARSLAVGLVSMLHGNLLLSFVEGDPRKLEARRAGVRRWVERALQGRRA